MYTLFIFRRDFRLRDNNTLSSLTSDKILPIFIFTPEQVKTSKYKSLRAIEFMKDSLKDLDTTLRTKGSKLHTFEGDNIKVLTSLCDSIKVKAIAFNMDYTPYALKRDKRIKTFCKQRGIDCIMGEDYLLHPMGTLNKKDGPYKVFTAFRNNAKKFKVRKPITKTITLVKIPNYNFKHSVQHRNRKIALSKCRKPIGPRDSLQPTTGLSPYIKFGCVSIREVYWLIKHPVIRTQLYWREFYYYIAFHFPTLRDSVPLKPLKHKKKWNVKFFKEWTEGKTGYPIVDAGMRELNTTGLMHNRARLITANFLTKLLRIDWRWGERYYATKLIDYDPSVNNGNWQWVASVGTDTAHPARRIFNPSLQSKRFDPKAKYILKYCPELKDIPVRDIHNWDTAYIKYNTYIPPIINYKTNRAAALKFYK